MLRDVQHVQAVFRRAKEGHEVFTGLGFLPHANGCSSNLRHTATATGLDALAHGCMPLPSFFDGHGDVRIFHGVGGHLDHEFLRDMHLFDLHLDDRSVGFLGIGFLCSKGLCLCCFGRLHLQALAFCQRCWRFLAHRSRRLKGFLGGF